MDCVVAIFLCLFLNFAKLRCAHFPSYLLFLSVQFLVWFLGYWFFFFTKMGQIFVKLTIFYRDTINLLWLRRYSYNAVFSLKDASFHSICFVFKTLLRFPFLGRIFYFKGYFLFCFLFVLRTFLMRAVF